jgi:ubiquinone/menaquinone biosynthesis C-methylase UbiE
MSCSSCGSAFPAEGGLVDFVDVRSLEEFALWQRAVYDGLITSARIPDYKRPEAVALYLDYCVDVAGRYGPLMPGWLGVKCRQVMDTLEPRPGELLLDVGCGTGTMLAMMEAVYGTRGVGVDFSRGAVESAIACRRGESEFFTADALQLPFRDGSFDIVTTLSVLEHVSDPARMISEIGRVLKPGGRMLLHTASKKNRWTWHWWQRLTSFGRYGLGVDDRVGHDQGNFFEQEGLESMVRVAGLDRVRTYAVHTMYTIMFDEAFPGLLPRLLGTRLLDTINSLLDTADAFPSRMGYGNEILATAWKG